MRETTSGSLDLDDPHWTEMQQQQMLHEMRVPPQLDATPTQTSPINDIKNQLKQIKDIHNNLKRSYDQT
jgi:hypothetical protein